MGSGFRWCRFAQPSATIWHPSGMFLETLLAMGCAAWGHAAYRWMAMGRVEATGSDVERLHFDCGTALEAVGRRGREVGKRAHPSLLWSLCSLRLNPRHRGRMSGGWMATRNAKDTKGLCHGRPGLMSYAGLRPRPGSMDEWDPGSGGVAPLNHRLQAVIPPGCARGRVLGDGGRPWGHAVPMGRG